MELLITARYCGPPRSGNGGYVAGALAHALGPAAGEPATVTLRRPPPLEAPMTLSGSGGRLEAYDDGTLVAEAVLGGESPEPVEPVDLETARRASSSYPGLRSHPFPTCFACGTAREDGLRIFPGRVDGDDDQSRVAAPWTPDESVIADFHEYDDPQPRACTAATWAALDCVGGWAGDFSEERPLVLGRMTAVLDALPALGEPHVVLGRPVGAEGRKVFTTSTLVDADARVVGRAAHTWIRVDPGVFS